MDVSWLWQSILGSLVWAVLAAIGTGLMVRLRRTNRRRADQILFAAAVFVVLMMGFGAFRWFGYLNTLSPKVTRSNVERQIRDWSDQFHYTITRTSIPDTEFSFELRAPSIPATPLVVARAKDAGFISICVS